MDITISQIAHGLAQLEGRQRPNRDDWTLARAAHPVLQGVAPTAEDEATADDLLAELRTPVGGGRRA